MNEFDINGFEIEQFNQYGLKQRAPSGVCPLCSHTRSAKNRKSKCASYDWKRGLGTCHHCNEVFQLHKLKRITEKVYLKPKQPVHDTLDRRVCDWFRTRGISKQTLQKAKITSRPGWVEFNYYANGELINRKSRNAKKDFLLEKGCELIWYNFDALLYNTEVVVVEGEIDALSFMEAGVENVISVPNGATNFGYVNSSIDLFDNIDKVYLAVDNDAAGQKLSQELIRRIGAEKMWVIDFDGEKDANDYLLKYDAVALSHTIINAIEVPLEYVKTLVDVEKDFEIAVLEGFSKGRITGLDNFDSIFSIVDHQFCVVTGIPSSGKSDFVDMICMGYNKKYDWPIGYASPENYPIHYHVHKLFRKAFDGMPTKNDIKTERYEKTKEYLDDNFYFIDLHSFSLENVLKKGAELVRRKGIKILVIDPYNKIRLRTKKELSINEYTNQYLNRIDEFARKYDCFVFLVAHPVKLYKREDGTYPCPSFYDVKGGGEMYDMSPNGLAVHRDYKNNITMVKILKVKFQFQGENNAECFFTWNKDSGKYVPFYKENQLPWE